MEANRLIRDVYTFKRGFPAPVVKLETMDRRSCYEQRQRQASSASQYFSCLPLFSMTSFTELRESRLWHLKCYL